jgi:hypothetical protein
LICADDDAAIAAAKQTTSSYGEVPGRTPRCRKKQMKQSIRLFVIPMRQLGMGTAKCVKSA